MQATPTVARVRCSLLQGVTAANVSVERPTQFALAIRLKSTGALRHHDRDTRACGQNHRMRGRRRALVFAAVAWPLTVIAQQSNKVFRIGIFPAGRASERAMIRRSLVFAAAAWPVTVSAQQQGKTYRIGYLSGRGSLERQDEAFRNRLRELGYIEGKNLVIEHDSTRDRTSVTVNWSPRWCDSTSIASWRAGPA